MKVSWERSSASSRLRTIRKISENTGRSYRRTNSRYAASSPVRARVTTSWSVDAGRLGSGSATRARASACQWGPRRGTFGGYVRHGQGVTDHWRGREAGLRTGGFHGDRAAVRPVEPPAQPECGPAVAAPGGGPAGLGAEAGRHLSGSLLRHHGSGRRAGQPIRVHRQGDWRRLRSGDAVAGGGEVGPI